MFQFPCRFAFLYTVSSSFKQDPEIKANFDAALYQLNAPTLTRRIFYTLT